ncbi:hypothetical protein GCM10027445_03580 [Amycolatopsis endophytica]|uniref:Uncharacterized protein n=1 Tax=Amycolatopsis endophytica TaxID=860233 RepID=A0A853B7N2_9PSEU|nr:hypothetical protein [Amycolatopsis endophytica]NYI91303.1 hypothetical protein [Amycolatopsis endophytica]
MHGLAGQYVPAAFVGFQGGEAPLGEPEGTCPGALPAEQDARTYVQAGQSSDRHRFPVACDLGAVNPFPSGATGDAWLAAAVCFAGNAPQNGSARIADVTITDGRAVAAIPVTKFVPDDIRTHLEEVACARSVAPSG